MRFCKHESALGICGVSGIYNWKGFTFIVKPLSYYAKTLKIYVDYTNVCNIGKYK